MKTTIPQLAAAVTAPVSEELARLIRELKPHVKRHLADFAEEMSPRNWRINITLRHRDDVSSA